MEQAPACANPCSKILCKSCRRFTTSRAPNKKTVYTPGPDPSGSTHRRLHKYCQLRAHFRGGVPRAPRPGARAQEQVDRAAGRQGASYLLCSGRCGRVQCAIARLSTCPNACRPATRDFVASRCSGCGSPGVYRVYVVEYIRIKRHVSTPLISYGMNHEPLSFSNDA